MAGVETDNDTHHFPLAREGDHLDDLGRLACFLQILPTDVLGKLKKGSLGLGSYESKLFGESSTPPKAGLRGLTYL